MKKIILILLIFIVNSQLSVVNSQDPYITIGKIKLRYDADSNRLRLGYSGTLTGIGALRLAKELDGQLFDFNTQHFLWQNGKLNLNTNILTEDSIATKKLTWKKDTTWVVLGESVSKWRSLTMYKPLWSNTGSLNIPDWKMYYESRNEFGVLTGSAEYFPLNDIKTWSKSVDISLDNNGELVANDITFPISSGKWFVTGEADVEFSGAVSEVNAYDSIWVLFGNGEDVIQPEVILSETKTKYAYASAVFCALQTRISFSCIIDEPGSYPQASFTLYAYCSNDAFSGIVPVTRKIKYYKINAVLIH